MEEWSGRRNGAYAPWERTFIHAAVEGAIKKSKERKMTAMPVVGLARNPHKRLLSNLSSEKRKEYPIITGVLDYFPDAIAMVSHVSYLGNLKHNPGQPLHWSRGKSADHLDCIGRHMVERKEIETDNIIHLANAAWRTLAELQIALEKEHALSLPYGAKDTK